MGCIHLKDQRTAFTLFICLIICALTFTFIICALTLYFVIWTICRFNNMFIFSCDLSRFKGNVTWYTVNLDLPPSERWTQVIKDKNSEVAVFLLLHDLLELRPLFLSLFSFLSVFDTHVWRMHVSCLFLLLNVIVFT